MKRKRTNSTSGPPTAPNQDVDNIGTQKRQKTNEGVDITECGFKGTISDLMDLINKLGFDDWIEVMVPEINAKFEIIKNVS